MAEIDKDALEHLAELVRIKLQPSEEEVLLRDLRKMLAHFETLNRLDTSSVEPMAGGTELRDVFRDDEPSAELRGKGVAGFPRAHKGFLKIPPVFE